MPLIRVIGGSRDGEFVELAKPWVHGVGVRLVKPMKLGDVFLSAEMEQYVFHELHFGTREEWRSRWFVVLPGWTALQIFEHMLSKWAPASDTIDLSLISGDSVRASLPPPKPVVPPRPKIDLDLD